MNYGFVHHSKKFYGQNEVVGERFDKLESLSVGWRVIMMLNM